MRMLINTYLILMPLIIYSCNSDRSKEVSSKSLKDKGISSNQSRIIGEWGIFVIIREDSEIYCNECPRVVFKDDGKAEVTNPEGEVEKYNWLIKDDTILFYFNKLDSKSFENKTFGEDKFIMEFSREEDFLELQLKQVKNEYSYILRK